MERKFLGRGTAFGKNQGVAGPESIPKSVAEVVKGEFWDIFTTPKSDLDFFGVWSKMSQNPPFTTTNIEL